MAPGARGFWLRSVVLAAVLGLAAAHAWSSFRTRVVHCSGELEALPEPAGWQSWTRVDAKYGDLMTLPVQTEPMWRGRVFGLVLAAEPMMGAKYPGYINTRLVDPALCPVSELSLDSWFTQGPDPVWTRHPEELSLHRPPAGETRVISARLLGPGLMTEGRRTRPPVFVAAFQPRMRWHYADLTRNAWLVYYFAILSALGLAALIGAVVLRLRAGSNTTRRERAYLVLRFGLWISVALFAFGMAGELLESLSRGLSQMV